jgi:hypothetical protein
VLGETDNTITTTIYEQYARYADITVEYEEGKNNEVIKFPLNLEGFTLPAD